ncbi:hypothetical protein COU56_05245 [Candidatus Pacearchaeota archaeon CG10_big_fil_rev_8_21_14_0_10_31_9]|nr:MAG: hypothetical protein COU56_05245 [Candidatus Pacearchaeota archaeon CG10_big_fil_rev_8_21_14_0_10_31_9]PIZ82507.1 MAG: hypothetical protein COX97_04460 [Candidatus Pacearchaeota archaeon CG_4_10_14_0_2_um_filter_05_32_18]
MRKRGRINGLAGQTIEQIIGQRTAQYLIYRITEIDRSLYGKAHFERLNKRLQESLQEKIMLREYEYKGGDLVEKKVNLPDPFTLTREDIKYISEEEAQEVFEEVAEFIFEYLEKGIPDYIKLQEMPEFQKFKEEMLGRKLEYKG